MVTDMVTYWLRMSIRVHALLRKGLGSGTSYVLQGSNMIRNALTPERSNVQCSLLDWTDKNAKLVVSNKGVRPAVVQRAEIVLDTPDGSKNSVILNPTESDPTLEPGKYRVLIFSDPNLEAPSGHPELSAILSALKVVPEPRDYPSGD